VTDSNPAMLDRDHIGGPGRPHHRDAAAGERVAFLGDHLPPGNPGRMHRTETID